MTKDESAMNMLPKLMAQFDVLNSETVAEFETKLNSVTIKAMELLESSIDDGSLALDAESLVNSVKVLTQARHTIAEDKRKLLETTIRGTVMLKAVQDSEEQKKLSDNKEKSVMEKYFDSLLPEGTTLEDTAKNSMFNVVNDDEEIVDDDNSSESSSDD